MIVENPGMFTIVEDAGRWGYARWGVGHAGAFDQRSWKLANRLVGNAEDAPVLECLGGGLLLRAERHVSLAVTGAHGTVLLDGRAHSTNTPLNAQRGTRVGLSVPHEGIRYYLAVAGGVRVPPVLGSHSYDTLSTLGPPPVRAGDTIHAGPHVGLPLVDHIAPAFPAWVFTITPGPDATETALSALLTRTWELDPQSNRIGVRLTGEPIAMPASDLPSKPMVLGAVQVPPNGLPIILGPDHPTTGGYPVVAVVTRSSMSDVAQWAGGPRRFMLARGAGELL